MNNTPITRGEVRMLVHDNIGRILGSYPVIQTAVAQFMFNHADEFLLTHSLRDGVPDHRGDMDILVLCEPDGTPSKVTAGKKQYPTSHLRIVFLNEEFWKNFSPQKFSFSSTNFAHQALLCIDISSRLLTMRDFESVNYFAYNISFRNKAPETTTLDKKTIARLANGYFGITSRNIVTRFGEHLRLAKNNGGSMLHSVWHSMMDYPEVLPRLNVWNIAHTLDQIYAIEEKLVKNTLAPLGLNAIPGGWEGIKMLHTLGLTNKRKIKLITPEDRDEALTKLERLNHPHGSPCCHYRRGHIRKLSETRHTYVTGHFVNADKEVINEEADSNLVVT